MIVDFHSHTVASDGSLTAQELADFMGERQVAVFSISDHDTLAAYGSFEVPAGSRVVTGVEINTSWRDNEVHILGYRLPLGPSPLDALLAANRQARRSRMARMVRRLREAGYGISEADVEREAVGAQAFGRPHVGKALVRLGIASDIESAFRNFLRRGKPGYEPSTHVTPAQAIEAIHASDGLAVLAHPGRLKDRAIIDELAAGGLDGLEAFYPSHTREDVDAFRALADRYGLLLTGGADFHDIRYHTSGVGMEVDDAQIAPFLRAVGAA
ncbi:MAG: PHP domain-containing protein [Vulcanimicrobiaceae bacterium]